MASINLSSMFGSNNTGSVLPSNASSVVPTNTGSVITTTSTPNIPQSSYFSDISHMDHSDTNDNIIADINSLQQIEAGLFKTLETNTNLKREEYEDVINKINSISQMRLKLYETLSNVNSLYKNTVSNSQETLYQQLFAIGIVEKQLDETKDRLNELKSTKNDKLRLVKINDYYGDKYNEHTILMKYVIIMLVPIIILSYMFNKGFIPRFLFFILLGIITIIGSIFIVTRLVSIWSRDNMNYQEYTWGFNPKSAPGVITGDNKNPWLTSGSIGTCVGDNCCTDGMIYDTVLDKCVYDNKTSTQSPSTGNTSKIATETFINNILTKKSNLSEKPDVTLSSEVMPSNF
jgi:hypothetical protein